jgi:hypothetical protein
MVVRSPFDSSRSIRTKQVREKRICHGKWLIDDGWNAPVFAICH